MTAKTATAPKGRTKRQPKVPDVHITSDGIEVRGPLARARKAVQALEGLVGAAGVAGLSAVIDLTYGNVWLRTGGKDVRGTIKGAEAMTPATLRRQMAICLADNAFDIARFAGAPAEEGALLQPWNCYADRDLAMAVRVQGHTLLELHQAVADSWATRPDNRWGNRWWNGRWSTTMVETYGVEAGLPGWSGMTGEIETHWPRTEPIFHLRHLDLGGGAYFCADRINRRVNLPRALTQAEIDAVGAGEGLLTLVPHPFLVARPPTVNGNRGGKRSTGFMLKNPRDGLNVRMAPIPQEVSDEARRIAAAALAAGGAEDHAPSLKPGRPSDYGKVVEEADLVMPRGSEPGGMPKVGVDMTRLADSLKSTFLQAMEKGVDPWPALAQTATTMIGVHSASDR